MDSNYYAMVDSMLESGRVPQEGEDELKDYCMPTGTAPREGSLCLEPGAFCLLNDGAFMTDGWTDAQKEEDLLRPGPLPLNHEY